MIDTEGRIIKILKEVSSGVALVGSDVLRPAPENRQQRRGGGGHSSKEAKGSTGSWTPRVSQVIGLRKR